MKRRGGSVGLGSALEGMLGRLDRRSGGRLRTAQATSAWQRIAGSLVLSHTTGAHLKGDTLYVYVDSPAWATELTAMSEQYRVSLNEEIGKTLVNKVTFTVSRRVQEEHRIRQAEEDVAESYGEDDAESIPLTETERAQVEASASAIPDAELREAAIRATIKDMEWKKGISAHNAPQERSDGF